jgi:hypothetical protein
LKIDEHFEQMKKVVDEFALSLACVLDGGMPHLSSRETMKAHPTSLHSPRPYGRAIHDSSTSQVL